MITEICKVKKSAAKGGIARVEIERQEKCASCNVCSFNKHSSIVVPAIADIACVEGDTVEVRMPEQSIKGAWLYLYLIPLATMLIGLIAFMRFEAWVQAIAIGVGLLLGFAVARLAEVGLRKQRKFMPVIVKKSETATSVSNANIQMIENIGG